MRYALEDPLLRFWFRFIYPVRSMLAQIDVVGVRDDGWTDLGECKWGTVRSPQAMLRELEEKAGAACYGLADLYAKGEDGADP